MSIYVYMYMYVYYKYHVLEEVIMLFEFLLMGALCDQSLIQP
jgi:hypothetical protein